MEERLEQIKRMQGFNIFDNKTCSKQKHDNPWNPMEESHHVADLNQRRNKSIPANVPKKKVNING
jgi:hypothetical protein